MRLLRVHTRLCTLYPCTLCLFDRYTIHYNIHTYISLLFIQIAWHGLIGESHILHLDKPTEHIIAIDSRSCEAKAFLFVHLLILRMLGTECLRTHNDVGTFSGYGAFGAVVPN